MKFAKYLPPLLLLICSVARGQNTSADEAFAGQLDLSPLRTIAVQDQQTIKTLDTFARQTLESDHRPWQLGRTGTRFSRCLTWPRRATSMTTPT